MLDGIFILLALCLVMTVASLLAGALPLSLGLSRSKTQLISAVGVGVLIGTSLIVIIPEGVETLYGASSHVHKEREHPVPTPQLHQKLAERGVRGEVQPDGADDRKAAALDFGTMPGSVIADDVLALPHPLLLVPRTEGKPKKISHAPKALQNANPIEKDKSRTPSPHAYVGVSLVLGFLLMYLIDKIPQHTSSESHVHRRPYHISLEHLPEGLARVDPTDGEPEAGESAGELPLASHASRGASTTIGLVIHAAADGIALGASSSTADTNLGLVVFLAIMVHKAPAAFGLTSVLLKQGLSRRRARAHLVVFSLAAPVGALATWILVNAAGRSQLGGGHDEQQTRWWTGILLLFSGGTFLYVAMHTMQEDQSGQSHDRQQYLRSSNSHISSDSGGGSNSDLQSSLVGEGPSWGDTLATVVGMLVPLLTRAGHNH